MSYTKFLESVIDKQFKFDDSKYIMYTKEKQILEVESISDNAKYISMVDYENMIFESARDVISKFSKTSDNNNVYGIFLFIDIEGSCNGLTFCNLDYYKKRVMEVYPNLDKNDEYSIIGVKYNEGDSKFRYYGEDFNNEDLLEASNAYYAISNEHPITNVTKDIVFDKNLFESRLVTVGINVVEKLKGYLGDIDTTEDFIIAVSLHDIPNSTIMKLLEKSNPIELLKKKFIEFKDIG
ncbi:hypothetical protein [Anaeromicrobium sediminis]|uniref:Uncharacterized protein n=1 Tax=Anaeromicrobium sediminis TaxID=1478221 RepID=A0A267MNB7_9FIRM|nr:hypothetical protein [Anaeromicrobium sediminis]PAB60323.1 hypothetical protein CCE28_05355 [Anaeromicrobium sediminis]